MTSSVVVVVVVTSLSSMYSNQILWGMQDTTAYK